MLFLCYHVIFMREASFLYCIRLVRGCLVQFTPLASWLRPPLSTSLRPRTLINRDMFVSLGWPGQLACDRRSVRAESRGIQEELIQTQHNSSHSSKKMAWMAEARFYTKSSVRPPMATMAHDIM